MISYCKHNKYKLVIVTHYPPTYKVLENTNKKKKLFSLYANHLDHLLSCNKVYMWICGHTHTNFNFISDKGTTILSNQLGKPKDNIKDFCKDFLCNIKF